MYIYIYIYIYILYTHIVEGIADVPLVGYAVFSSYLAI